MESVKESSIELIKKLPDDCSLEDIQYELYAKAKIESGIKDIKADKIISETQMDEEISSWLR